MENAFVISYGIRNHILSDPTGGRIYFASESDGRAHFGYEYQCDERDASGRCTKPYQSIDEITEAIKQKYGIPC